MSVNQQGKAKKLLSGTARRTGLLGTGSTMAAAIVLAGMGALGAAVPVSAQMAPGLSGPGAAQVTLPVERPVVSRPPTGAVQSVPTPIASEFYTARRGVTLDAPVVPPRLQRIAPVRISGSVTLDTIAPVRISGRGSPEGVPTIRIPAPADVTPLPVSLPAPVVISTKTTAAQPDSPSLVSVQNTPFNSVTTTNFNTTTNGINVLAQAAYDGTEVDFRPGVAVDVVELFANEAIINWTTFTAGAAGTDVTFLGNGGNLEFTSAQSDFTVLNRVFTPGFDSAIRVDGAITSTILSGGITGGNVWFYSAGGIIVGPGANIDVGSLVLSASQLDSIDSGGSQMNFLGASNANSAVVIENGAAINANNTNSYVAVVAPRIEQGGTVRVNGSAAYVAAEQAQLTINNGLFDIAVGLGSGDANGIVHTGSTGGAASQATVNGLGDIVNADPHAIYMVAVPKNQAMTMLVGGTVGFDAATMASRTDNGTIILSAGAGVTTDGLLSNPGITIETGTAIANASVALENAVLTSDAEIYASDTVDLTQRGLNPQTLEYARLTVGGDARGGYDLNINSDNAIVIGVQDNSTIDIAGDLILSTAASGASGGTITVTASNAQGSSAGGPPPPPAPSDAGQINVGGNFFIDASGNGRDDFATFRNNGGTGVGEDAAGGMINLTVENNGALNVGGSLLLDASGQGGKGENQNGSSAGGAVNLSITSGTLDVTGSLTLDASAVSAQEGKDTAGGLGLLGNTSTGGSVVLDLAGGQASAGLLSLNVRADGSSGSDTTVAQVTTATGGSATIDVTAGTHTFGSSVLDAEAVAGGSYDAAGMSTASDAVRGTVDVAVSGTDSLLQITDDLTIIASTTGIVGDSGATVVNIAVTGTGAAGGLDVSDELRVEAVAQDASQTADNYAGSISILADDSSISFGSITLETVASPSGTSSFGAGDGNDFVAGDITLLSQNGATISGGRGDLSARSTGRDLNGGNGTGGNILLQANNGTITFTDVLETNSTGLGGTGVDADGNAGIGRGGSVRFALSGATGALNFDGLTATSDGVVFSFGEGGFGGFNGFDGDGGTGIAGSVTFDLTGGTFAAGAVSISAEGQGGPGGDSTNVPVASMSVAPMSGGLTANAGSVSAMNSPGSSGLPKAGRGGDGTGGTVVFNLDGTTATMTSLDVSADGIAGVGGSASIDTNNRGGDGGDAFGGSATFNALSGSLTVTGNLTVSANGGGEFSRGNGGFGEGTEGGQGGQATGGNAVFNLTGAATIAAGNVIVDASAFAGNGGGSGPTFGSVSVPGQYAGDGGTATAGSAEFNSTSGAITFGTLTVSANGDGGDGGDNFGFSTGEADANGGVGGDGIGGIATINLNQDDATNPTYVIQATGEGGQGGTGLDGGNGGAGTGGTGRLNVNNVDVSLTSITIDSSGIGGDGGFSDGEGGNGGNGGAASGGSSILDVNGFDGRLQSILGSTIRSNGQGGAGADGNSPIFGAVAPGDGGTGGDAAAGLVQIIARDGGGLGLLVDGGISADGTGGRGGDGGSDFSGALTGDGGNAGSATGGRIEVLAQTAGIVTVTSVSTDAEFSADAIGALGGNGGTSAFGDLGVLGTNGSATGGSVLFSADSVDTAINVATGLVITAAAQAASDARTASTGGDATGGTISLTAVDDATIGVTGSTRLDASAIAGSSTASAGDAQGGTIAVTLTGANGVFGALLAEAAATGGNGDPAFGSPGAIGGNATGGTVSISADTSSSLAVSNITAGTFGIAGRGGQGGDGEGGEAGGSAQGGDVTVDLAGTISNLASISVSSSANGGAGGRGGITAQGGLGGLGQGGTATVNVTGTGAVLPSLTSLFVDAGGFGGAGGTGGEGDDFFAGGGGGSGGSGIAGSGAFTLSGVGAAFDFDPAVISLTSSASGGTGGAGGSNFLGGVAGAGGAGGDATGGTLTIQANSGSAIDFAGGSVPFVLASNGTGGAGGVGGQIDMATGGFAGNGGDGGTGTGGSPTLRAVGGTINGADVSLTAVGTGGDGGLGGDDGTVVIGASGNGGDGVGGNPLVEVLEGSPGIMNFGTLTLLANGSAGGGSLSGNDLGGLVTINDLSPDPLGVMSFAALNVDASGSGSTVGGGFVMNGGSGATTVTGNVAINVAGDIVYNFDGNGQLIVGGTTLLDTDANIIITHTNNAGNVRSIDSAGRFDAQADGDFTSTDNAIISSGNTLSLDVLGNITAHDVRGVGNVQINAGQNAILNNATVSGAPTTFVGGAGVTVFSGLTVQAGLQTGGSIDEFDPSFSASITGVVTSTGFVNINAGGNVTFVNGANVVSDNGITVFTGDDIIVQNGARIEAGANAAGPANTANPFSSANNLTLAAGELIDTGQLLGTGATPIASIIAAGDIVANDFAVVMTANAVDGLGGSIDASSVSIDIDNAPNAGDAQNNDAGLLSANCLQGTVCLGSISADNTISIGQNSNNDVISLTVEQASVAADDILITIRDNIVMGTDGIPTQLAATNQFLITSLAGDIDLRDAVVTSDQILIDAAGSLLGTGSLISANDIGIDVGQDISLALIDTDGQLTTVAGVGGVADDTYVAPGSISIGQYDGGNLGFRVTASDDISFGAINVAGSNVIRLVAGTDGTGDVFLGTATGANGIILEGDDASFTDLTSADFLRITARGAISGGSLTTDTFLTLQGTTIDVGNLSSGDTVFVAGSIGDVTVGNVTANDVAQFNAAGNLSVGDVTVIGSRVSLRSDADILAGTVTTSGTNSEIFVNAAGAFTYTALDSGDTVIINAGSVSGGDISSVDNILINGDTLNLGNIATTAILVVLDSTVGDISAGTITGANASIQIDSAAAAIIGTVNSRGFSFDTVGNGILADVTSTSNMRIDVGGDLTAGNIDAQGTLTNVPVSVGGDADIASLNSETTLGLGVTGALTGGAFTSANGTSITAGSVDVDSVGSDNQSAFVTSTVGDATIDTISSQFASRVTAAGVASVGTANSGTTTQITGTNVRLDAGTIGGDLTLNATAGDIVGTGTVDVAGGIDLDATGNISVGDLEAQAGTLSANAGGIVGFTSLTSSSNMDIMGAAGINGGAINSGGSLDVDATAGDIAVGNVIATSVSTFDASGLITTGDITGGGLGIRLNAGTNLVTGIVSTTGAVADISLIAAGTLDYTSVDGSRLVTINGGAVSGGNVTGAGQVDIEGESLDVGDVVSVGGFALLESTFGDVVAGNVTANAFGVNVTSAANATVGDLTGRGITLSADNDATVGEANSAGSLTFTVGNNLVSGNLDAQATSPGMTVTVGGDADIAGASSNGLLTVTVDGVLTGGEFSSASLNRLTGASIDIDLAESTAQSVVVNATAGNAVVGATDSQFGTTVTATGDVDVGAATSGTFVTLRGDNVTLDSGDVGGNLTLDATGGDVSGTGTVIVGGAVNLDATGNIGFGSLEAQNGNFTADAGGAIGFTAATASGNILFNTSGAINGGDLTAGGTLDLDGGNIAVGDASGTSIAFTSAANILFNSITSPNAITLSALNGTIGANTGNGDIDSDDDVTLTAQAIAVGDITSNGSVSANATAGDASFGTVDAANDITITASGNPSLVNAISGGNTSITGAAVTFNNGTIGGDLSLTATTGNIDGNGAVTVAGAIDLLAAGSVSFGDLAAQGGDFTVDAGGNIAFTSIVADQFAIILAGLNVTGTGNIQAGAGVTVRGQNGSVSANDIVSGGSINIDAGTTASFNDLTAGANALRIVAGGDVTIRDVVSASNASISSGGDLAYRDVTITGDAGFVSAGSVAGNSIDAGQNIVLSGDNGGAITAESLIAGAGIDVDTSGMVAVTDIEAQGRVAIEGGTGVTIDTLAGDTAQLEAANGTIAIAGDISANGLVEADAQAVLLNASDDLTVAATATGGNILITVGGNLDVQGANASGNITLVSGGSTAVNAAVGPLTTAPPSGFQGTQQITTTNGGNVSITAATDIVINSDVNAAGDLTLDAGNLIDLQATASGMTVAATSADMNIATSGALGRSDETTDIIISTQGDITLGGMPSAAASGFTLDNDEFSRIHSGGDLTISANAGPNGGGNITVDVLDVAVAAGTGSPTDGNIANSGGLFLEADDSVFVTGAMTVSGVGADSFVGIDAVNAVAIDTDAGNIRLQDTAGNIAGALGITASTITAISSAAEADITGSSVADIDIRLGQVDTPRPDGFIQADSVTLNADSSVLIQNSGTGTEFADRAGITANDLTINATDPAAAIVINGVIGGNTGIDAIAVTGVPSSFDTASTINGCVIANPASCAPTTPNTPNGPGNPDDGSVQDLIDTQIDPATPLPDSAASIVVEFRQNPERERDLLIDEPVTGAGNDDLWIGEDGCAPGDEACFAENTLEPAE